MYLLENTLIFITNLTGKQTTWFFCQCLIWFGYQKCHLYMLKNSKGPPRLLRGSNGHQMVVILVLPLSALWGRDDEFSMRKPCLAFGTADDSWVMMTKMASCVKLYNTCTKVCFVNVLLMFSPTVLSSIKHRELKSSGWQSYSVSISDFSELELKPKLWSSGASGAPVCTALSANSPPIFKNYFSFNETILLFSTKTRPKSVRWCASVNRSPVWVIRLIKLLDEKYD